MGRSAHGIEYGTAAPGKSTRRSEQGRECEEPGCTTVLSVYNDSPTCWQHSPFTRRRPTPRT
jgi:hypothetical protein